MRSSCVVTRAKNQRTSMFTTGSPLYTLGDTLGETTRVVREVAAVLEEACLDFGSLRWPVHNISQSIASVSKMCRLDELTHVFANARFRVPLYSILRWSAAVGIIGQRATTYPRERTSKLCFSLIL